jgi:hypothetical protein
VKQKPVMQIVYSLQQKSEISESNVLSLNVTKISNVWYEVRL